MPVAVQTVAWGLRPLTFLSYCQRRFGNTFTVRLPEKDSLVVLSDPHIVLLDEPTAAISVRQVAEVLELIRRLRDQGIAVLLISHRMPDVFEVADRVLVLRRGRKVAEKPIAESSPEEVTGLITGAIHAA